MTTTVLETLVGDGKKFQTAEQLAESKLQADQYIEKLKGDLAALQSQVSAGSGVSSEALDRILAEIKSNQTGTPPVKSSSDSSNQSGAGPTEAEIVKIIERRELAQVAARNTETAMAQVRKVYGDKSEQFLTKLATDVGMSVDELKAIAARSPASFVKIAGLTGNAQSTTASGTVNTQSVTTTTSDGSVRNKAFYDAKRVEMGSKKFAFDSALQIQMHQDMQRLGDSWDS